MIPIETPLVEYDKETETYVVTVGDVKVFIEYGEEEKFSWFRTDKYLRGDSKIYSGKIITKEGEPED